MKYGIDTRCQHLADDNKDEIYGAISYPIYQSATFARDRVGGGSGYDYSRLQNPTREHLEKIVASLEEGIDALAFSTGMAAITALMEIFKPGDHIIKRPSVPQHQCEKWTDIYQRGFKQCGCRGLYPG